VGWGCEEFVVILQVQDGRQGGLRFSHVDVCWRYRHHSLLPGLPPHPTPPLPKPTPRFLCRRHTTPNLVRPACQAVLLMLGKGTALSHGAPLFPVECQACTATAWDVLFSSACPTLLNAYSPDADTVWLSAQPMQPFDRAANEGSPCDHSCRAPL